MRNKLMVFFLLYLMLVFLTGQVGLAAPRFIVEIIYEVKEGDALINIANKFDVSVEKIREANGLAEDEFIKVGDKLEIPQSYDSKFAKEDRIEFYQRKSKLSQYQLNCCQEYEVKIRKEDDNHKVDVSHLRTLDYYIKRGDNLYDLAREFNTSIRVLKKLNNLEETNIIRRGDRIKLPVNNLNPKEVLYHTISDREFELLARLIHGEARGESYIGQVAVGAVILNRVIDPYFPDTIIEVIYQPGQFSPVANGQINLRPNRTAYRAAKAALRGEDPTRGAEYFYNPQTAKHMSWFRTRETIVMIGNHAFAK